MSEGAPLYCRRSFSFSQKRTPPTKNRHVFRFLPSPLLEKLEVSGLIKGGGVDFIEGGKTQEVPGQLLGKGDSPKETVIPRENT